MATTIPTVTALPSPPQSNDPTNFDGRADPFVQGLKKLSTELGATIPSMNTAIGEAQAAANQAQGFAGQAVNAPGTSSTSTTSNSITAGAKTFSTQAGKVYAVGQTVNLARTSDPLNSRMQGLVTAWDSGAGTLGVNVAAGSLIGSGTFTDWTLSLSPDVLNTSALGRTLMQSATAAAARALLGNLSLTDIFETRTNVGQVMAQGLVPNIAAANSSTHPSLVFVVSNNANSGASALMGFRRDGIYAVYLGLDNDNKMKIGGWSMGNNAFELWHRGNTTVDANGFIKQA